MFLVVNWRCIRNPSAGGAEVHLHRIFSLLACWGRHVTVLCSGWAGCQPEEIIDGIRYVRVGREKFFQGQWKKPFRKLLAENHFDLIVDDISKIPLGVSRWTHLPTIAICHHIHGEMLKHELPWPLAKYIGWMERRIPMIYSHTPILSVSESTRKELIQLGMKPELLGYLHNGADLPTLPADGWPKSSEPYVVYLGRLQRYKNVECILRAWPKVISKVPKARLVIVGTGKHEGYLKQLARRMGDVSIEFTGHVSEQRKAEILSRAWVSVASSCKEGWGISIIEANLAGIPVVVSDVPGFRDSVVHEKTGFLYPYDDDVALADATVRLLQDRLLRETMSQSARQWAARFSWQASADEFMAEVVRFYPQFRGRLRGDVE